MASGGVEQSSREGCSEECRRQTISPPDPEAGDRLLAGAPWRSLLVATSSMIEVAKHLQLLLFITIEMHWIWSIVGGGLSTSQVGPLPGGYRWSTRIVDPDLVTSVITSPNFACDPYVRGNGSVDAHCTQDRWVSLLLRGVIRTSDTVTLQWIRNDYVVHVQYYTLHWSK